VNAVKHGSRTKLERCLSAELRIEFDERGRVFAAKAGTV